MKRSLSLILAAIMLMSLVACGGNTNANNGGNTGSTGGTGTSTSTEGVTGQGTKVEASTDTEAEYAKELTICLALADLDPGESWNATREGYQRLVFDNLLYLDEETDEITMQLAESVEWTDDTYSALHVVLRDDVVFSNGDPVTTADVEFSFGRNTYSMMTSTYDYSEIISDTEMIIHLQKCFPDFYNYLSRAYCAVVCKAEAEKNPDGLALIGSGPYVYDMDTYMAASSITLRRNDKFWGEQNPTEVINLVKIADASAAAVALQNGEIDWVGNLNDNELPALEADEKLAVTKYNSYNFIYMSFNDHGDSTALSEEELNFRRAIACAINKEDIIAGVGGGMVMTSMWPYDHPAYIANESDYEHDLSFNPEKAKEYLAQAGGKTEFTCLVDTSRSWVKLSAQVVQEYLKQVGITMNIEETDTTGFSAMTKWDVFEYDASMWSNLFSMKSGSYNPYTPNNSVNRAKMVDPEIVDAINTAQAASDPEVQNEMFQVMQRKLHGYVSYLPFIWREMNYAYTDGLEGFELTPGPCFVFRNIRLRIN